MKNTAVLKTEDSRHLYLDPCILAFIFGHSSFSYKIILITKHFPVPFPDEHNSVHLWPI